MLKTVFLIVMLLLSINGILAWQNIKETKDGSGTIKAAKRTACDSGGLMLPASTILFKSIHLFK